MFHVYSNENVTSPEPAGYWEMMQYEEDSQRASDAAQEKKQEILEELEDDNLIDIAAEAFGELYRTKYSNEADKIINEIVKAIGSGCNKEMTVGELISNLSSGAEKVVTDYIFTHAN
ncbi:hypothetical protein SALWKB2_1884 [Snodgrassella alvi wkB2]|uniref:Phage protein n=1 Tax=Snodgrassella alvi TaxID=1196083 RepID=A0ABD7Z1A8_9NEIS|nr:hypothetical protein [Snodgrassella alvi]AHN29266.1 hypothetical protein SALWKB2_1884 [Snodgrassella alvi wkB2]PIT44509.1 hypothetical protein BHC45_06420 [Snodgrassella alvi]UOO97716.1 hypothetical protein LVJ87_06460 [Snodgrassella alvi wkB2]WLS98340.1 hypothetical protein RAM05_10940 [Snodgrassella alvi]